MSPIFVRMLRFCGAENTHGAQDKPKKQPSGTEHGAEHPNAHNTTGTENTENENCPTKAAIALFVQTRRLQAVANTAFPQKLGFMTKNPGVAPSMAQSTRTPTTPPAPKTQRTRIAPQRLLSPFLGAKTNCKNRGGGHRAVFCNVYWLCFKSL